jgi:hypothetical protein
VRELGSKAQSSNKSGFEVQYRFAKPGFMNQSVGFRFAELGFSISGRGFRLTG